jgi:hypothetical protein
MAKRVPRVQITHPATLSAGILGSGRTKKASIICKINNALQIQARR